MAYIASVKNDQIKAAKKLTVKKYQQQAGAYLLEGPHQVGEAIKAGITPKHLYVTSKHLKDRNLRPFYAQITEISEVVAKHLSDTATPQGIFAVLERPVQKLPEALTGQVLLLDGLQDPGNVGTLVRTADAAGIKQVVFGQGTADPFNPKVLRAMQGSQFHVNVTIAKLGPVIETLKAQGIPVYGTELNVNARAYHKVAPKSAFGLVVGNEGSGMAEALLAQTDSNLYIPIKGQAESLNVAVAAGILMFHLTALD